MEARALGSLIFRIKLTVNKTGRGDMANVSVNEYVDAAIDNESFERTHIKNAAAIIAQFLQVRKGLTGRIPSDDLSATAAVLTAAIWKRSEK